MNKKLSSLFVLTAVLIVLPVIAKAQIDVGGTLDKITDMLLLIFSGLVILMFLWAGILYLTAHGDPGQFQKANKAVLYALVGTAVGLLGYSIQQTVCDLLIGVSC